MDIKQKRYIKVNALDWKQGNVTGFSSKPLIEQNDNVIKMVRIAAHAAYPMHTHPHKTETLFILEGELEVTINTTTYQGEQYDFFVFPVGIAHGLKNTSDKNCIVFIGSIKN